MNVVALVMLKIKLCVNKTCCHGVHGKSLGPCQTLQKEGLEMF